MHHCNSMPAPRLRWLALALAATALVGLLALGIITVSGYEGLGHAASRAQAACMREQTALLKQALDVGEAPFAPHERCGVELPAIELEER